jgi:hypothetical protein
VPSTITLVRACQENRIHTYALWVLGKSGNYFRTFLIVPLHVTIVKPKLWMTNVCEATSLEVEDRMQSSPLNNFTTGLSLIFLSGQSSRRTSQSSNGIQATPYSMYPNLSWNKELKWLHQEVQWLFLLINNLISLNYHNELKLMVQGATEVLTMRQSGESVSHTMQKLW